MSFRTRIVKITAVVALSGAALGIGSSTAMAADGDPSQWGKSSAEVSAGRVNEYEGQHLTADEDASLNRRVNEYEGQHLTADEDASLTRKVNEYEGQHR